MVVEKEKRERLAARVDRGSRECERERDRGKASGRSTPVGERGGGVRFR